MENAIVAGDPEPPVLVRPTREQDVDAMLAIYRRHIRRGVEDSAETSGMPEPDDLRQRRKNFRNHRLPHLVATFRGDVGATPMWCCSGSARPIASP